MTTKEDPVEEQMDDEMDEETTPLQRPESESGTLRGQAGSIMTWDGRGRMWKVSPTMLLPLVWDMEKCPPTGTRSMQDLPNLDPEN